VSQGFKNDEALLSDAITARQAEAILADAQSGMLQRLLDLPKRLYDQISVDVSYSNVWEEMYTFPERRPRTFNLIVATLKTSVADIIVQLSEQLSTRKAVIDWRRCAAFASFGFFYEGLIQWFLYVTVFSKLCPNAIRFANAPWEEKLRDTAGQIDLIKQVFYDNLILSTLFFFPVFYVIKEMVQESDKSSSSINSVMKGLRMYARNFKEDNLTSMAIWMPGDCLVYAVPMFARMPLGHTLSFVWTMMLSHMRGGAGHGVVVLNDKDLGGIEQHSLREK